jgi:thioredoxin-related protein
MKNIFYILSVLLITIACIYQKPENAEIKFLNNAVGMAKAANKLLIIEIWAPDGEPGVRLKHDIFENEKNREFLSENFLSLKVSPDDSVYNPLLKHFNLENQSSVIIMDKNGNEIDRTVSYDGNSEEYLQFLLDVSEGRNLYSVVFSTYKKDSLNVNSNYVLAKKLLLRHQLIDAIKHFDRVLQFDPENKFGHNPECILKITGSEIALTCCNTAE